MAFLAGMLDHAVAPAAGRTGMTLPERDVALVALAAPCAGLPLAGGAGVLLVPAPWRRCRGRPGMTAGARSAASPRRQSRRARAGSQRQLRLSARTGLAVPVPSAEEALEQAASEVESQAAERVLEIDAAEQVLWSQVAQAAEARAHRSRRASWDPGRHGIGLGDFP